MLKTGAPAAKFQHFVAGQIVDSFATKCGNISSSYLATFSAPVLIDKLARSINHMQFGTDLKHPFHDPKSTQPTLQNPTFAIDMLECSNRRLSS